jgi:hypothetical protein
LSKDVFQRIFFRELDECGRVMLMAATKRDSALVSYLRSKLDVKPVNWMACAMLRDHWHVIKMAADFDVAPVTEPRSAFGAVRAGSIPRYLTTLLKDPTLLGRGLISAIGEGAVDANVRTIFWFVTRSTDFGSKTPSQLAWPAVGNELVRGALLNTNTDAALRVIKLAGKAMRATFASWLFPVADIVSSGRIDIMSHLAAKAVLRVAGQPLLGAATLHKTRDMRPMMAWLEDHGAAWDGDSRIGLSLATALFCNTEWAVSHGCPTDEPLLGLRTMIVYGTQQHYEWWYAQACGCDGLSLSLVRQCFEAGMDAWSPTQRADFLRWIIELTGTLSDSLVVDGDTWRWLAERCVDAGDAAAFAIIFTHHPQGIRFERLMPRTTALNQRKKLAVLEAVREVMALPPMSYDALLKLIRADSGTEAAGQNKRAREDKDDE